MVWGVAAPVFVVALYPLLKPVMRRARRRRSLASEPERDEPSPDSDAPADDAPDGHGESVADDEEDSTSD